MATIEKPIPNIYTNPNSLLIGFSCSDNVILYYSKLRLRLISGMINNYLEQYNFLLKENVILDVGSFDSNEVSIFLEFCDTLSITTTDLEKKKALVDICGYFDIYGNDDDKAIVRDFEVIDAIYHTFDREELKLQWKDFKNY